MNPQSVQQPTGFQPSPTVAIPGVPTVANQNPFITPALQQVKQLQQQAIDSLQQQGQPVELTDPRQQGVSTNAIKQATDMLSKPTATVDFKELSKEGYTPTQITQYLEDHPNTALKNAPVNWDANVTQNTIIPKAAPVTETVGERQPGVEVFSGGITTGTGLGVPVGTPVATPPGTWKVVQTNTGAKQNGKIGDSDGQGWGNFVLVQNQQTGEMLRYAHLSDVGVANGDTIKGNKVVGLSGMSGNVTGPHLNLQLLSPKGEPEDVLQSQYAQYIPLAQQ